MEYERVKERIEKESYPFVKLSYHEYAFVRESHPEIDSVSLLTEVILDIKKKLDYSHIKSLEKQSFNNYLKRKLNHFYMLARLLLKRKKLKLIIKIMRELKYLAKELRNFNKNNSLL